jgi:nucleotide-binding universal stress UspA family protein
MKGLFNPTCDRYGHILTGLGVSPEVMAPFVFPTAEEMAFLPGAANGVISGPSPEVAGDLSKKGKVPFRIRKILVPVDSEHTKPADLKGVIRLARRLDAQITLLDCYEAPRSFFSAQGDSSFAGIIRRRELNLVRLQTLCAGVQKSWSKCLWLFEEGPLPAGILRVSNSMRADLIVMPVSLDAASKNWSTIEVADELVRKAGCPVLAGRAITSDEVRHGTRRE